MPSFTATPALSALPPAPGPREPPVGYVHAHVSSGLWLGSARARPQQELRGQERVRLGPCSVSLPGPLPWAGDVTLLLQTALLPGISNCSFPLGLRVVTAGLY